jgi:chemotaxis protein MotA
MEKKHFEFTTILGISSSLLMIFIAVKAHGELNAFFDLTSILIVIGGTVFTTSACFPWKELKSFFRTLNKVIFGRRSRPSDIATQLIRICEISRKKSMTELEHNILVNDNHILHKGISIINDGATIEQAEIILHDETTSLNSGHEAASDILRKAAEISPAMGLIGTLIGLVQMLGNLHDPSKIGPAMAVSLLTTLYGAFMAYVIFLPLSAKIERDAQEELLSAKITIRALFSIVKRENPHHLQNAINSMLSVQDRIKANRHLPGF